MLFVQDQDIANFLYGKIGDCTIDDAYSEVVVAPTTIAKATRESLQQKAIALLEKGHDTHFIARQVGKHERTVKNWLRPYRQLKELREG
ncbi:hypothetical protein D3C84_874500 [compost metagenome]